MILVESVKSGPFQNEVHSYDMQHLNWRIHVCRMSDREIQARVNEVDTSTYHKPHTSSHCCYIYFIFTFSSHNMLNMDSISCVE